MSLQWVTPASLESQPTPTAAPETASPPSHLSDEAIAEVAEELRKIRNTSSMNLALRVGELVVNRIFLGNFDRVRSKGRKDHSFRKLAAHPKLPFSPMSLWRSVGVYELTSRMPGLPNARNLSVSHLYAVLGLPDETQEWLLRAANEHGWGVVELEKKANKHRTRRSKLETPPLSPVMRSLRNLERFSTKLEVIVDDDDDPLEPDQVRRALESVDRIRAWCDELGQRLDNLARQRKPSPVDQ